MNENITVDLKSKNKKDFLNAIDLYLNNIKGFKPCIDCYPYSNFGIWHKLIKMGNFLPLNSFFFIGEGKLNTCAVQYILLHDKSIGKNTVAAFVYGIGIVLFEEFEDRLTLQNIRSLYRKIVLDSPPPQAILRDYRNAQFKLQQMKKSKYLFNEKNGEVFLIEDCYMLPKDIVCKGVKLTVRSNGCLVWKKHEVLRFGVFCGTIKEFEPTNNFETIKEKLIQMSKDKLEAQHEKNLEEIAIFSNF